MGIPGIYEEIGDGERISLSKLAIETFEKTGRPLRIAVDTAIWQFQTQAGQGGSNPAVRTFYYRLLRLLSVSVQAIFVFDGPHKPSIKRNKKVGQGGPSVSNATTKRMLKLFGFPYHSAPGEAEAECALLQREGIVDAVLSEDVDTLMFGCGKTLRRWTSEGTRGNKTPTHVTVHNSKVIKDGPSKLDREGMVLVAMMKGGDYDTTGIPHCGIKVACEAARAGYGKKLCQIPRSDDVAIAAWKADLLRELQTNESKFFKTRHKSLKLPEDFPNKTILGYYTHPIVSSSSKIEKLKEETVWDGEIDIEGLRAFVSDTFDWSSRGGAIKFIRGLAPALLIYKLRVRGDRRASGYGDPILTSIDETELVRSICGQRIHISTDGMPELRVVFHPNDIVNLDLEAEVDDGGDQDYGRDGLAPIHDDGEIEAYISDDESSRSPSPTKRSTPPYDPTQLQKEWVSRTIAKIGVPLKVEDYEESLRKPKAKPKAVKKSIKAAPKTKGGMKTGAILRFVQVTKPSADDASTSIPPAKSSASTPILPPVDLTSSLDYASSRPTLPPPKPRTRGTTRISTDSTTTTNPRPRRAAAKGTAPSQPILSRTNPWSISQPKSVGPSITKAFTSSQNTAQKSQSTFIDLASSSPAQSRSPPPQKFSTPQKHPHSPTPPSWSGSDADEQEVDLPDLPNTVTRTRGSRSIPPLDGNLLTPSSSEKERGRKEGPPRRKRHSPDPNTSRTSATNDDEMEKTARILDFASSPPLPPPLQEPEEPSLPPLQASSRRKEPLSVSPPRRTQQTRKPKQNQFIELSSSPLPLPTQFGSSATQQQQQQQQQFSSQFHPSQQPDLSLSQENNEKNKKKKKFLLLRESIGTFQEIDEDEMEAKKQNGGMIRGRTGKERRAFRESQVEVLDLRGE